MVRVQGPLLSLSARGWLGRITYRRAHLVRNPYPIGLRTFPPVPISFEPTWSSKTVRWSEVNSFWSTRCGIGWGSKHGTWSSMKANWQAVTGPFFFQNISQYYSPIGWHYCRRRTWHGIIWIVTKPWIPTNPQTAKQQAWRQKLADAVAAWQGMNQTTKDYYNKLAYPVHMSGYNRFIHYYLKDKPC